MTVQWLLKLSDRIGLPADQVGLQPPGRPDARTVAEVCGGSLKFNFNYLEVYAFTIIHRDT